MAKEVTVHSWCDVHLGVSEGVQRVESKPHVLTVDGAGPLELDLCDEHEASLLRPLLDVLMEHGATPTDEAMTAPPEMRCSVCGKMIANRNALQAHVRTKHDTTLDDLEGTAKYKCPECGKGYGRPQGIIMHARTAHHMDLDAIRAAITDQENAVATVSCPKCGKPFSKTGRGEQSLSRHLNSSHKIRGEARLKALREAGVEA